MASKAIGSYSSRSVNFKQIKMESVCAELNQMFVCAYFIFGRAVNSMLSIVWSHLKSPCIYFTKTMHHHRHQHTYTQIHGIATALRHMNWKISMIIGHSRRNVCSALSIKRYVLYTHVDIKCSLLKLKLWTPVLHSIRARVEYQWKLNENPLAFQVAEHAP